MVFNAQRNSETKKKESVGKNGRSNGKRNTAGKKAAVTRTSMQGRKTYKAMNLKNQIEPVTGDGPTQYTRGSRKEKTVEKMGGRGPTGAEMAAMFAQHIRAHQPNSSGRKRVRNDDMEIDLENPGSNQKILKKSGQSLEISSEDGKAAAVQQSRQLP
jgi:hypothetical protein